MKITEYAIRKNRYNTYNEYLNTGKDYFTMYLLFKLYYSEIKKYKNIIKLINKIKNTLYYD